MGSEREERPATAATPTARGSGSAAPVAGGASGTGGQGGQRRLVDLQRQAGNRAVVGLTGAAPTTIRRFLSVKDFAALTSEGPLTRKSTAQKAIEVMLADYRSLAAPVPAGSGSSAGKAAAKETPGTVPTDKIDRALALLDRMQTAAELWVKAHSIEDDGMLLGGSATTPSSKAKDRGDGTTGYTPWRDFTVPGTTPTTPGGVMRFDPSRTNRMLGMSMFLRQVHQQRTALLDRKAWGDRNGITQEAVTTPADADDAVQAHYSGDFNSIFAKLGVLLDLAMPRNGDTANFEASFKVPIPDTPAYIGGLLRFKGKRSEKGAVEAQVEVAPQVSVGLPFADVRAAIGLYLRISGKTAADATTLISYALYRSMRQSNLPAEVSDVLYGGGTSRYARLKADQWSRGVEKKMWSSAKAGDDKDNYIETGVFAEAGIKADVDVAGQGLGLDASAKYTTGSRYDRTSIDNRKGGAGEQNQRSDGLFTQHVASLFGRGAEKDLSRGYHMVTLSGSVKAGPFSGSLMFVATVRRQGFHKAERKGLDDWVVEEIKLTGKAAAQIPGGQLATVGFLLVREVVNAVRVQTVKLVQDSKTSTAQLGGQMIDIGEVVLPLSGLGDLPTTVLGGFGGLAGVSPTAKVGVEAELQGAMENMPSKGKADRKWKFAMELRLLSSTDLDAAGLATVKISKGSRIAGGKWESGGKGWTAT